MKVGMLALHIVRIKKGKQQVNIVQVKEILRAINSITNGHFYKWMKKF